tara:strand:+ start:49030 stop:49341 length:312 start_codon:yes stop_codon:yes gene_type:complete
MNTSFLALITAIATIIAATSFLSARKSRKTVKSTLVDPQALGAMSAEDLLELVVGVPLKDLVIDGDSIEITISTNGHPIAGNQYVATDSCGSIKLTAGSQLAN